MQNQVGSWAPEAVLINWDHGIRNSFVEFSNENVSGSSWKHEAEYWNLEGDMANRMLLKKECGFTARGKSSMQLHTGMVTAVGTYLMFVLEGAPQ